MLALNLPKETADLYRVNLAGLGNKGKSPSLEEPKAGAPGGSASVDEKVKVQSPKCVLAGAVTVASIPEG